MNETTRKQTIDAVREIYGKRLKLIDRAIKAAELARDHAGYLMAIESALASLRMARKQTEIELDKQIEYWEAIE